MWKFLNSSWRRWRDLRKKVLKLVVRGCTGRNALDCTFYTACDGGQVTVTGFRELPWIAREHHFIKQRHFSAPWYPCFLRVDLIILIYIDGAWFSELNLGWNCMFYEMLSKPATLSSIFHIQHIVQFLLCLLLCQSYRARKCTGKL